MISIKNYLIDGANFQARAVLAALQGRIGDGIESSWDSEWKCYGAEVVVARWENCREQGYVVSLRNKANEQINLIWYEHRNSDAICVVKWKQLTISAPTIADAQFGDVYKNKGDVSFQANPGEYQLVADWIYDALESHWNNKGE